MNRYHAATAATSFPMMSLRAAPRAAWQSIYLPSRRRSRGSSVSMRPPIPAPLRLLDIHYMTKGSSILVHPCAPAPLVQGFPPVIYTASGQGTVRAKHFTLTKKTFINQYSVRVVRVVRVVFKYRTCAHARAVNRFFLSFLFYIIRKSTLTTLTMPGFVRVSALTIHPDQP